MSRTAAIRIAAAVLAAIIVAFSVFTYLAYSAAFTPTETVVGHLSAGRFGDGPATPRSNTAASKSAKSKTSRIRVIKQS